MARTPRTQVNDDSTVALVSLRAELQEALALARGRETQVKEWRAVAAELLEHLEGLLEHRGEKPPTPCAGCRDIAARAREMLKLQ
jgi:hypothetical protein